MCILNLTINKQYNLIEEDYVEVIKFMYIKVLNSLSFRTESEPYGISFNKNIRTIMFTGEKNINY